MKTNTIKKVLYTTMCGITLAGIGMSTTQTVFADTTSNTTSLSSNSTSQTSQATNSSQTSDSGVHESKTHTLKQTYVVYGAGTSEEVRQHLNKIFGVDGMEYKTLTATANDYNTFINKGQNSGTTNAAMISSVAIAPSDPGSGVKVNIKDYDGQDNITEVTSQQYAMVAQMAGVTDIMITVSANRPVSGTSALTGVYEALEADGATLNKDNTATANKMLNATNGAIQDNKNDKKYPSQLMTAVGQASKNIAKDKQAGKNLTQQDIKKALTDALKENGILDKTSPAQQDKISNALVSFSNSPISNDKSYVKNVNNTINNVKNTIGSTMANAKEWLHSQEAKSLWSKIKSWFVNAWNKITSIFNSDKDKNNNSTEQSSSTQSSSTQSSSTSENQQ